METTQAKELNLMQDAYNPQEARSIICSFIDEKVNYYKLQKHCQWESNHSSDCTEIDQKIERLNAQKNEFMEILSNAKSTGKKVSINGTFGVSLIG